MAAAAAVAAAWIRLQEGLACDQLAEVLHRQMSQQAEASQEGQAQRAQGADLDAGGCEVPWTRPR